jgi:glycosyltransferase involved in cell wall biosynthesis
MPKNPGRAPHVVVVIPAHNEEELLGGTIAAIPRSIPGVDRVTVLVIDDGSRDATATVARDADVVVRHTVNRGLARTFMTGLRAALQLGADIIVTTDADDQYRADGIPTILAPILDGQADLVIGRRDLRASDAYDAPKRFAHRIGRLAVRLASGLDVPDPPSGFRAMTDAVAARTFVHGDFTYTLETTIHAARNGFAIRSVDVDVNPVQRPSRLFRAWPIYVLRSVSTILRIGVLHRPFRVFAGISVLLFVPALTLVGRFVVGWLRFGNTQREASLIVGVILLGLAMQFLLTAFVMDSLRANRGLLEEQRAARSLEHSRRRD